jgi:hypothetical protein
MSEDRDKLMKGTDEIETEDVEAHRLKHNATDEPQADGDDDVEAHRLKA